jgi:hypothetical protein
MSWVHPAWLEFQRQRFTRHDAHRFIRPDAERYMRPDTEHKHATERSDVSNIEEVHEVELAEQRLELARLRLDWELLKFAIKAHKAGFDPAQPRDGRGRWTDGFSIVAAGVPRIPQGRPPDSRDRTATCKKIADWIAENGPSVLDGIARTSWLYPAFPTIWSYLDAPKSLGELQENLRPKTGYDVRHIVERTAAESAGYPKSRIDADDNLVRIPRMKHWEING